MSPIDRPWALSRPISRRVVSLPFAFFPRFSMLQAQIPLKLLGSNGFCRPPPRDRRPRSTACAVFNVYV